MENMTATISQYCGAWNEKTPEAVKAALTQCCAPALTYTDRNAHIYTSDEQHLVRGIDELTALVMRSHELTPGRTFSLLNVPQCFDGHGHYSWGVNLPGKGDAAGWDYIRYNDENLITEIIGFLPEQP